MEQILMGNRDKEHTLLFYANGACVGFGLQTTGIEWSRLRSILETWTLTWLYSGSLSVIYSSLAGFCFLSFSSA